jgi:hypothetical protein
MKLDPVMAEIRAYREAYAEKFGGDLEAMAADIRRRTHEDGRKVVKRSPKYIDDSEERVPVAPPSKD